MPIWEVAQHPTRLAPREAHVWLLDLDSFSERQESFAPLLDDDERERMGRFVFPQDRRRYAVCHGILRTLLGEYLGTDPASVAIERGEFGKPRLSKAVNHNDLGFNVSHSSEVCLVAFAWGSEVGIDVEKQRVGVSTQEIASRFFASQEIRELAELPSEERDAGFLRCWTRKEAYVKARGEGLQIALDRFAVSLRAADEVRLTSVDSIRWRILDLSQGSEFFAAVALEQRIEKVACFRFDGNA